MNNMQQQSNIEWMKFIKCEGEKHLGIAVIRYERRFIFRFKILPSEQGGYWATTSSVKTGNVNGKDKYEPAFSFDSEYEKSLVTEFVLQNVERELSQTRANQNTSLFQPSNVPHMTQQQQQINGNSYNGNLSNFNDDNIPF